MMMKRPPTSRFASLPSRELENIQVAHLKRSFELAPDSALAHALARRVNEALARDEAEKDEVRVQPGELLVEAQGKRLALPLLTAAWGRKLAEGVEVQAVRRQLEYERSTVALSLWSTAVGTPRFSEMRMSDARRTM